jgi:hypothetical protein
MPKPLQERARLLEAQSATAGSTGSRLMQLISPGWGSSGYYSAAVLEQAAADIVIPAGTHMYADHPTEEEASARPGRSIMDLISVTTTDARIATPADVTAGADQGALVAEVRVAAPYRELIDDIGSDIGVSIRGDATDITVGEAEGRSGRIIEGLAHVSSVDWVTHAGRGGKVLSVLESARANHRAITRGLTEATVNDTREALNSELGDAYAGDKTWVWVRDFDDTTVWFEIEGPDGQDLYAQPYTQSADGTVALTGDRTEVRVVTTYVPATRPDGTTTTESREDTMPQIQIEESEHTRLVEAAGRVTTLENERATAVQRAEAAEAALAERDRRDRATVLINERANESGIAFTALEARGLLAELPLTESGDLDEAAFTTAVDTNVAEKKRSAGAGTPRGFGAFQTGGAVTEDVDARLAALDSRLGIKKGA